MAGISALLLWLLASGSGFLVHGRRAKSTLKDAELHDEGSVMSDDISQGDPTKISHTEGTRAVLKHSSYLRTRPGITPEKTLHLKLCKGPKFDCSRELLVSTLMPVAVNPTRNLPTTSYICWSKSPNARKAVKELTSERDEQSTKKALNDKCMWEAYELLLQPSEGGAIYALWKKDSWHESVMTRVFQLREGVKCGVYETYSPKVNFGILCWPTSIETQVQPAEVEQATRQVVQPLGPGSAIGNATVFDLDLGVEQRALGFVPGSWPPGPVTISAVIPGTAAHTLGLRADDALVAVGGRSPLSLVAVGGMQEQELLAALRVRPLKLRFVRY